MKGRFGAKTSGGVFRSVLPTICFFVVVLIGFFWVVSGMTASVEEEQLASTEQAIRRTAVHCYAVEGQYPQSLQYMQEHYGLHIDQTRFVVHYQPIAANLMPTITVFPMSELDTVETGAQAPQTAPLSAAATIVIDDDDAI